MLSVNRPIGDHYIIIDVESCGIWAERIRYGPVRLRLMPRTWGDSVIVK